ncbi:MAG: ribosome recycling factor [Microthrixaceae bacterium]|jgi:ribosome recycling factor|nr:ribosome recycling factor [Microthrixaceae bacterium]
MMESADDVLLEADDRMSKALDFLGEQLAGVRTGKASPHLVENVQVPYYGTLTRLKEIAGIATPEPGLIVINAYDPTALPDIERAILAANLGVTPKNDGRVIRVPIPPLSEERRNELVKVAKRMAEESRVSIRNVRRDSNEHIKTLQKSGKITEDEKDAAIKEIQSSTDEYTAKVDKALADRERAIMGG